MDMKKIGISDVTLRQEAGKADAAVSFKEKLEIAKLLDRLRVDVIELPPIRNDQADTLMIKSIGMAVQNSMLALPVNPLTCEGVELAFNALKEAALPCLQITVPVSAVQMEYVCHRKPDKLLLLIDELVKKARDLCQTVEFAADDATRSERGFLYQALEAAVRAGANRITLNDSAGLLLPHEIGAFVADVRAHATGLENCVLGIQCPNTLHMAPACAVAAIGAGAELVKAGICKGEAMYLPSFCDVVRMRGVEMHMETGLQLTELNRCAGQVDWILHEKRRAQSPFDTGVRQMDADGPKLNGESTLPEIIHCVKKLGYDLSEEDCAKVYDAFRRIASKKDVGERELDAIVASAALQVPPTYTLDSYVVNSGNVITASAHVQLTKQEKQLQGIALGDGPIDASFLAIEQIVGHHYELDDFQIQAVTEGREAMGSALVRLRSGGRVYAGKGISTDIIGASIRAYINALNKIVYEEAGR